MKGGDKNCDVSCRMSHNLRVLRQDVLYEKQIKKDLISFDSGAY